MAAEAEFAIAPVTEADRPALEAYLAARSDTCMLMRANLRAAGLAWHAPDGERLQAQYVLARRGGAVIGAVAHCWNGMVAIQADAHAGELVVDVVRRSGRRVAGLLGELARVAAARTALGLDAAAVTMDSDETLMSLSLDRLAVPPALRDGVVRGRRAEPRDRELLIAWRTAYGLETELQQTAAEAEERAASTVDAMLAQADRPIWLVEHDGAPVATCAHNAVLPDSVQIGGVFTPPALRGRGHARAVVAASLIDARATGATRAILFTPRADAVAAYRAVGFAAIGHYGIVLFAR